MIKGWLIAAMFVAGTADAQEWQTVHGLTPDRLKEELAAAQADGFVPFEIDAYFQGGDLRYSVIWMEKPGAAWQLRVGMDAEGLASNTEQFRAQGLAPVSLSVETDGDIAEYAAVWMDAGGAEWQLRIDDTADQLQHAVDTLGAAGWMPTVVSAYTVAGEERFATVWRRAEGIEWFLRAKLSADDYQATFDALSPQGYVPIDLAADTRQGATRFAGVWVRLPAAWEARHDLTAQQQLDFNAQSGREHLFPHALAAYPTKDGVRFAAAWHGLPRASGASADAPE